MSQPSNADLTTPLPIDTAMTDSAANVYNHLLLGYLVLFFNKFDLFPLFNLGVSAAQLVDTYNFEPGRLATVLETAAALGALSLTNKDLYRLTPLGHDLNRHRGFFTWALGGYGPLLEHTDLFLTYPRTQWQPYVRGDYVAIGSDEANQGLMQAAVDQVIDSLPVSRIADLGCGNAGRLVELLARRPELTGVGIDIDEQAVQVARKNRDHYNLQQRLHLLCQDAFQALAKPAPELEDVDMVMSFMMLHDLFNNQALTGRLFQNMKQAFPRAKYFVLADTCAAELTGPPPVFTAGFQLVHALRGIKLFPLPYYHDQFRQAGLRLVSQHSLHVPHTYLFVLET